MSYQPVYRVLRECKIQLLSEVGDECYAYLLNMLEHRVSCGKLIPAKDGKLLAGAPRQPRGAHCKLDFAIPYSKSSLYDFVHLRILVTTVDYVKYVIVLGYELRERKSRE